MKITLLTILFFCFFTSIHAQKGLIKTRLSNNKLILKSKTPTQPAQGITVPDKLYPSDDSARNKNNSTTPASWPFNSLPHQQTYGHQNCDHNAGFCDPRNLPLSPNGKLLSVDGDEVDFRTSTNPSVTNICGTPRGYINNATNKSAGCSFTVACDNPANRDAAPTTIKYFQLVWHVMQSTSGGASSNINQARIDALMAELNADYTTHNMIFCADPATFYVDDVNYTHNSNTEEVSLKTTYNVSPTQLINIYVVGSMTAGGYARFPYDPMGGTSTTGGIVLNRGNCNVGTHTLAHEMGHTFGLEHTFSGVDERTQCSACYEQVRNANGSSNTSGVPTPFGGPYTTQGDQEGDWCSDTHPHDTYSYNCSTSSNSNGACDSNPWSGAPVNNHMSYSFCSSQFTSQQSSRMHCMTATYLNSWISYGGGICGAQPPVADFDATPTTWIAPSNVNFNDLSTPQSIITGWTWVFDVAGSGTVTCAGCTGANATLVGQTPPVVTYPNIGLYTVSLTVTSANGPDSETKVDYIEVTASAGDCDTLDTDWFTPAPSASFYSGGFGYFTGVPCEGSAAPIDPAGFYQQYFTPSPGSSIVGAVTVGLGGLVDPDDDMTFQIVAYEDDAANPGFPDFVAGPIALRSFSPTQIGVPPGLGYQVFNIPFTCAPTVAGATFHVGVEMFSGDATDELLLLSNADGQGGSPLTNTSSTSFCGDSDYNVNGMLCGYAALDFDLYCYPQMGWYKPTPLALGFVENVVCDTTNISIITTTLYDGAGCTAPSGPNTGMVNWTYLFNDGTTYSSTSEIPIINRTYTTSGQDTLTIMALNDCGRADTTIWTLPYNFMGTPDADFTKSPLNPICMGAPGVTFTSNTSDYADYTWDFGDGTPPVSSGNTNTINHVYTTPGLYYVQLDVTSLGYQPIDTFYLETFAGGFPAGYRRFNNDPFTPHPFVNPPFTGSNATAWLIFDIDGSGDNEAVSTSYNTVSTQQADDWLITTGIGALPANQMLSWEAEAISAVFPDGYEVRISTAQLPATTANYSTVLFSTAAENSFRTTRTADLSSYAGQVVFIAFINNSTDEYLLSIDNIRVGTIGQGCANTEQKLDYVEIIDCSVIPPTAVLNATPTNGCAPLDVLFTDATVVGDAAISWVWNFGDAQFSTAQNPPLHTYSLPGSYYVIFQACNTGGCTIDTITINVINDNLTIIASVLSNYNGSEISCSGAADGAAFAQETFSGPPPPPFPPPPPLTYLWSDGQTTNVATGLDIGTHMVSVTNITGCMDTASVTISEPSPVIVSVDSSINVDCNADSTGAIFISASGGIGTLTYSWSNGSTLEDISSLSPNVYTVTVSDNNSCTATSSITITINLGTGVPANAGPNQNVCGDFATFSANDPSPHSGVWTVVSGSGTITTPTAFNSTVTGLGAGLNVFEWTITTVVGCVSTSQVTISGKTFKYALNGETSNTYCTDAGGWNHFYNAGDEILLSIRGNLSGAPAGFPLITVNDNGTWYQQTQGPFTAASCASGLTSGEELFEMERSWNVDFGGGAFIGTYNLRFYYQPAERAAIETAAVNWMATYPACGYMYKYPNPIGFYWFKNTGSNYIPPNYEGVQYAGTVGAASGINYTQMNGIPSFSGGSGAIILTPDPLLKTDWLYFDGVTDNKVNYLRWATEAEQNSDYFNLQRSKDGINFETIGSVAAQGNSTTINQYNFDDVHPYTGENYYRLELISTDGSFDYSHTVLIVIADIDLGYVFYPNPTDNLVHYQYEANVAEQLEIEIIDVLGRILKTQKVNSVVGINNIPISLGAYSVGSYIIRVHNNANGSVHTSKVIRSTHAK